MPLSRPHYPVVFTPPELLLRADSVIDEMVRLAVYDGVYPTFFPFPPWLASGAIWRRAVKDRVGYSRRYDGLFLGLDERTDEPSILRMKLV